MYVQWLLSLMYPVSFFVSFLSEHGFFDNRQYKSGDQSSPAD